jgi:hypothetical protein
MDPALNIQTLNKLRRALREKCLINKSCHPQHDKTHGVTARLTSEMIAKNGSEVPSHLPYEYCSDLAPSLVLLGVLKSDVRDQHCEIGDAGREAVRSGREVRKRISTAAGFKVVQCWQKRVDLSGDFVDFVGKIESICMS